MKNILGFARIDSPLRLAVAYAGLGILWIVVSDGWVAWWSDEGIGEWMLDATKGLAFIGVTATLLFFLTRQLVTQNQAAQAALRDSQQRLALALEVANQGLFDLNVQTGEGMVNDTYATMLGHGPGNFYESLATWRERLHPDDRERVSRNYADYIAGRIGEYRAEYRLQTATGGWRWIYSVGRVVERDAAGRPIRMLGTHTDITDRKDAEAQTANALAFARAMLNSSPEGIIAYRSDGQAVIANESAARMIGTGLEDLLRQNFRQLESWRASGMLAAAEKALAGDQVVRFRGQVTTTFNRKLYAEVQFVPFDHQHGRHLLMIMGDMTENRLLQENLQVMHAAVLAAPVGWVVTDPEGVIEWTNPGFTTLTGYTAGEVRGKNPRVLKSGRHAADVYAELWATIKRGGVWSGEMFNQRKDGTLYHEYMTIVPVQDDGGNIRHFVAMKQDITDRKNLEQELARAQRLESIGLLASGIAHDLNNIFAPIQLSLELLKIKYPAADGKKMLELIETSVHRGAGIVRQVLTFARGIESQRLVMNPKYLVKELGQILDETLPRHIKVETSVGADLQSVEGDSTQLHQVLLNLAINARDAMSAGGRLRIRAENTLVDQARATRNPPLKPGPHVAFTVADTGSGIPPEVLEHMFEPFYTTKPRGQGTGLGLSTVYGIVRSHGGAVEVSTKLGVGTEFTVLLPARGSPDARSDSHPPLAEPVVGAGRRVLVVDDEESIRLITLHTLQRHGFVAEVAIDGVEALEIFRADPARFAIVITDLMMPRMGGRELVKEIRRLVPALPIITSSGLSDERPDAPMADLLATLGVKTSLRKPYTEAELLAALRRELEPEKPAQG